MIDNDKQPDFEGECQIGELCYKCGAVCDEFMNGKVETLATAEKHILDEVKNMFLIKLYNAYKEFNPFWIELEGK